MKKLFALLILVAAAFQLHAQVATDTSSTKKEPAPPSTSGNMTIAVQTLGDTDAVFSYAEIMAEFPGGQVAFYKYLQESIHYPAEEAKAGKQGTVYVSFVVEKDGSVSNVKILKGVADAPGLSQEAIRVITAMPKWTPGKINGKTVRVSVTQPIKFVLPAK